MLRQALIQGHEHRCSSCVGQKRLQKVTELWTEVLGYDAAVFENLSSDSTPDDMPLALQGALYARVTSIYGGSSEIQRNIIARRSLGL